MSMTEPLLLGLGAFATLATIGGFMDFDDDWTGVIVLFIASITWAFVGLSAFNVLLPHNQPEATTIAVRPIVYFALGMSIFTFILTLWTFGDALRDDVESANVDAFR